LSAIAVFIIVLGQPYRVFTSFNVSRITRAQAAFTTTCDIELIRNLRRSGGEVAMARPCLLCIDDNPRLLELRKATLESYGYRVEIASTSGAAIRMLEKTSAEAVLLEYKVEGIDAEAVACHIKRRFPSLPIILLSAYSEIPERTLWLVDEYMMKSEMPEGLAQAMERATHSAAIQEARALRRDGSRHRAA
jgi:CheY-like chemotaxis protein